MGYQLVLLLLLILLASSVGTISGFGTSTIMVPVLSLFFPLPVVLFFAGAIHWFGDIWKMVLFRGGVRWRLLALFGVSGVAASSVGAALVAAVDASSLSRLLGGFLLAYVGWLSLRPQWRLPARDETAVAGGALSGFLAGLFGVGGAVRGAFLSAYNLRKEVYLFTSGAISLVVDSSRLLAYWGGGTRLPAELLAALAAGVPASLVGALLAKRLVVRIPERQFRQVVAAFLALVGLKLLLWPG